MADTFQLEIVTPEKMVVKDVAEEIQIPGKNGYLGILPGHAPLITELAVGRDHLSQGRPDVLSVGGLGFCRSASGQGHDPGRDRRASAGNRCEARPGIEAEGRGSFARPAKPKPISLTRKTRSNGPRRASKSRKRRLDAVTACHPERPSGREGPMHFAVSPNSRSRNSMLLLQLLPPEQSSYQYETSCSRDKLHPPRC